MIAVRALSRAALVERLQTYGCRYIRTLPDGTEIWETGWHEPFSLTPEPDGKYDEWQYFQLVARTIASTMPSDWDQEANKSKNGVSDKGKRDQKKK
jgi:hypothetical protein